ncbi:MAG: hypothetical protein IKG18_13575 [Atopobiaceae bacterium]|nr:hypothetical protein [Atopobiaceae bacterium]
MSEWLNLTEGQRRRMEEAESAEEKAAVIREAVGEPKELSLEELDAVSGGQQVVIPPTHEEIDAYWDLVESQAKVSELNALMMAFELKLIPFAAYPVDHCTSFFTVNPIAGERAKMHRMLDGKQG